LFAIVTGMTEGTLEEGEDGASIIVNWKVNLVSGKM